MRRGTLALTAIGAAVAVAAGLALASGSDVPSPPAPTPALTSGQLPVARRADPSLDRYLRTPRPRTLTRRMNDGQRWLSARADPLVLHDSDPRVSQFVTGWGSRPQASVYVNATGVLPWRPTQLRAARRWLVKAGGKPVKVDEWHMLDIRQPAARRWWLYGSDGKASCHRSRDHRGALDLLACGYTGLWVDNVLTIPDQWFKPKPGIDAASWGEGLVALLTELRRAAPRAHLAINAHWTDLDFGWSPQPAIDPSAPLIRAAQQADQLVIEGGAIDAGLNYAAPASAAWSYRRLLQFASAVHAHGIAVQWEKTGSDDLTANAAERLGRLPSCRDGDHRRRQPAWRKGSAVWQAHVRTAAFNYASALLVANAGDGAGDMCEYPGRGWVGYTRNLGAPAGALRDDGTLLLREFARGLVAVNPSGDNAALTLPHDRRGIDLASTRWPQPTTPVGALTLAPRTAAVIEYR